MELYREMTKTAHGPKRPINFRYDQKDIRNDPALSLAFEAWLYYTLHLVVNVVGEL